MGFPIRHLATPLIALAVAMTPPALRAQPNALDSAHTFVQPPASDPGRPGQTVLLPNGSAGTTTGGTPYYQMLQTPGGAAVMAPNGNGSSTVIAPAGQTGTVRPP